LFNAAAIPALISALAIFSLRWFLQPRMAESLAGELAVRQIR
jgi:hypothetical protein